MPERTSPIRRAYQIPAGVLPRQGWGTRFGADAGFAVKVHGKYWMSVFVDRQLSAPGLMRRRQRLATGGVIAHCVSCVGEVWTIHSEPLGRGRVGLIAYTAKGKALAAGAGRLTPKAEFVFALSTLYKGITNAIKIDYKVEGKAKSDGSYEVTGSVTVSDSR